MNCSVEYEENKDGERSLCISSCCLKEERFPSRHRRSLLRIMQNREGRRTDTPEYPGYKSVLNHQFRGEEESRMKK